MRNPPRLQTSQRGFSLLELITAVSILAIILLVIFNITNETSKTWKRSTAKIEQFQGARRAFDSISRNLAQTTLNTYWDYVNSTGTFRTPTNASTFVPANYARKSELHFITGPASTVMSSSSVSDTVTHSIFFQAPLGSGTGTTPVAASLLNACGYFLAFGEDASVPSYVTAKSYRFRLFEFIEPTNSLLVYQTAVGSNSRDWFSGSRIVLSGTPTARPIADNIIAFVILPQKATSTTATATSLYSTGYTYDTRVSPMFSSATNQVETSHQLPPLLEVVMIAIDEVSAQRLLPSSVTTLADAQSALGITFSTLFTAPANLETDIETVTTALENKRASYRVFRTRIPIRNGNWSS